LGSKTVGRLPGMRKDRILNAVALVILPAVFCLVAGRDILLPGIQDDELLHAPASICLLKHTEQTPARVLYTVDVFGYHFPVMHTMYLGSLKSYVLAVGFAFMGINVLALRMTTILIAALGLFFFIRFAGECFGNRVGWWSGLLIASDPSFILCCRSDWGPVSIAFVLRMAGMFYLLRWWRNRRTARPLLICAMLMGLGIYDKANFFWFIAAVVVSGSLFWVLSPDRPSVRKGLVRNAVLVGIAGSSPFWFYNIGHHFGTLRAINQPGAVSQTIIERIAMLSNTLNGTCIAAYMFGSSVKGFAMSRTCLWPVFLCAISVLIVYGFVNARQRRKLLALVALALTTIIQILLTPHTIGPHHWLFLYPFPHLIVVVAALGIRPCAGTKWGRVLPACGYLVLCLCLACNISTVYNNGKLMVATGGQWVWNSAIYDLANVLQADYGDRTIQLMDWGSYNPLFFLSLGNLHLAESFWPYLADSEPKEELLNQVRDGKNVFVLRSVSSAVFLSAGRAFFNAVQQTGVRVKQDRVLHDRQGNEIYRVMECK